MTDPNDVQGLLALLNALANDCDSTDGWTDAAPTIRLAATTIAQLKQRVGELEAASPRATGDVAEAKAAYYDGYTDGMVQGGLVNFEEDWLKSETRDAALSTMQAADPLQEGWQPIDTLNFDPSPVRPIRAWHPQIGEFIARTRYGQSGVGSATEWALARAAINKHIPVEEGE